LFDEVEKAHPDVFNILLQVLDDGRLTDGQGRIVDFKNTIIILTSNLGSDLILEAAENNSANDDSEVPEEVKNQIQFLLKKTFRPEFLNRIDETVIFQQLGKNCINSIVKLQIERVLTRLENKRIELAFDESVINFISDKGYDPAMGARPIKRAIQTYVENTLAKEILSGTIKEGDKLTATVENDAIVYKKG